MAKDEKGASPEAPPSINPHVAKREWVLQKNFGYLHGRRHYHFPKGERFDQEKDKKTIETLIKAGADLVEA